MEKELKEKLLYAKSHEWVLIKDDNTALVGISDFAQAEMGDITYVDVPDIDDEFSQGDDFGAVESVKASSDLLMPVSGKVIEVNDELYDNPQLLNESPYESWIIKVEITNEQNSLDSETASLMTGDEYIKFINK